MTAAIEPTTTEPDPEAAFSEEAAPPPPQQTGLRCLVTVARHHRTDLSVDRLAHEYRIGTEEPTAAQLVRMAKSAGLHSRTAVIDPATAASDRMAFPALARLVNGNWVVIVGRDAETGQIGVFDPLAENGKLLLLSLDDLRQAWKGETVFIKRSYRLNDPHQPFGLRWFIPEILRQGKLFRDVIVCALVLAVLALALPMFTQVVLDRVLVHNGSSTLTVLAVGMLAVLIFEAAFGYLRQYLLLYATNKIDIRVAVRTFAQLLRLPIQFFERNPSGVLIKHMQQANQIRNFLTGQLLFTVLDNFIVLVVLPVLLFYSWQLTLLVLGFTVVTLGTIALMIPAFQRRLKALYEADAHRQSLLVETIQGMRTVKSLALEPQQRQEWDDRSARTVMMLHDVSRISLVGTTITQFLSKAMTVAIIVVGVQLVFAGELTIGALIAFQMLAGRVSGPLLQLVGLIQGYQETSLAVKMLGNVMNAPAERASDGGLRPDIRGSIQFERVLFRYAPDGAPALNDVSFQIRPGTIFGLVGRSGSGKTTVTRLIQGLYTAQQGIVRVDGTDIREIDLVHLRTRIGVVLQENFLFSGTVRENIAAAVPGASLDQVVHAARLAGADEFIERLPKGYDTVLEENGANLSGGQKQRLAIARALITQPPILILDEATSALDPESEAIIQRNLRAIAAGRTLVIVSHRLSSLVGADKIMVLHQGNLEAAGTHTELLARSRTYRTLWDQQTRHMAGAPARAAAE